MDTQVQDTKVDLQWAEDLANSIEFKLLEYEVNKDTDERP